MGNRTTGFRFGLLLAGWLAALAGMPAWAVSLDRLYEADMEVADQSAARRGEALRNALAEVLVRVTGDRAVLQQPSVTGLLADPGRYVQQFRYRQEAEGDPARLRLWARFDGARLERALRDRGLPYWGRERPETLVWLALEDGGRRQLLGEPDESPVKDAVMAAAERRGLPLVFPLQDLEDRGRVKFTDVWGGFLGPVQEASERYRPQALLVGRLYRRGSGAWQADWILRVQGAEQRWSQSEASLEGLAAGGVDQAADELATRFAVVDTGESDRLAIRVSGVTDLEDYARLNRYFASLSLVQKAQLESLSGGQAEYGLQLQGDRGGLERALSIGNVLIPAEDGLPLHYRLRP